MCSPKSVSGRERDHGSERVSHQDYIAVLPLNKVLSKNFAFLFTITIMPFTSDLLGKFSANPLAIDIFAANLLLATMETQLTVIYGRRKDLVTPETAQQTRAARYRVAASVFVIALSIVLAWVNPDAAKYCWLLLAVAPRLADRWSGR